LVFLVNISLNDEEVFNGIPVINALRNSSKIANCRGLFPARDTNAGATTENYPKGLYVYWRDGFYMSVNYSSADYTFNLPKTAQLIVGTKTLSPAGVIIWAE